jgi:hypothetical protein
MFAVFHMAGIVPDSYDILNMTVSIGAMNGASSFKTLGVILSGPAALVRMLSPKRQTSQRKNSPTAVRCKARHQR